MDHVHPVSIGQPGYGTTDPAVPDQAEREPGESSAEHQVRRPDPLLAAADQAVALGHPTQQRQHDRERQLGGRLGQDVRRVRDDDTAAPAGLDVHVVDPDGVVGDDP